MKGSDVNNNLRDSARQFAELYIDSSRKVGEAMLDLHERSTSWARETPLNPLFEMQRNAGKQMLENSIELARKVFGFAEKEDQIISQP
jgi:hypothetical protein